MHLAICSTQIHSSSWLTSHPVHSVSCLNPHAHTPYCFSMFGVPSVSAKLSAWSFCIFLALGLQKVIPEKVLPAIRMYGSIDRRCLFKRVFPPKMWRPPTHLSQHFLKQQNNFKMGGGEKVPNKEKCRILHRFSLRIKRLNNPHKSSFSFQIGYNKGTFVK